jgi:hypothetical protein
MQKTLMGMAQLFFKRAACFETFPESSSASEVSIDILIAFL